MSAVCKSTHYRLIQSKTHVEHWSNTTMIFDMSYIMSRSIASEPVALLDLLSASQIIQGKLLWVERCKILGNETSRSDFQKLIRNICTYRRDIRNDAQNTSRLTVESVLSWRDWSVRLNSSRPSEKHVKWL